MNQKEKNRVMVHKTTAEMVRRDEANKKLIFAASNKIKPVLKQLDSTLTGLDENAVASHRSMYGRNKVTHEKKKSLPARLAGAFINLSPRYCSAWQSCRFSRISLFLFISKCRKKCRR